MMTLQRLRDVVFPLLLVGALVGGGLWLHRTWYGAGFDDGQREGELQVTQLKLEQAEQQSTLQRTAREHIEALTTALQAAQRHLNQIAGQLASEQRQYRETTDRLTGEIHRVTTLYRRAQGAAAEPLPQCVFTRGFVRLYDEATGAYPVSASSHSNGATASPSASDPTWELDSELSQAEFLEHHIRYAEQCRGITAQLNGLIEAVGGGRS